VLLELGIRLVLRESGGRGLVRNDYVERSSRERPRHEGRVSGGKEEVEVDCFYFNPTVFTAHTGDTLKLTLSNESSTLHNFSLPDQDIDMDVPADGSITVTVVFPDSGTQVFFCKYHQSQGMVGGLEVETD
jgi:plastocyanin